MNLLPQQNLYCLKKHNFCDNVTCFGDNFVLLTIHIGVLKSKIVITTKIWFAEVMLTKRFVEATNSFFSV